MPGFYPEDEYDLAGFSVGLVDYDKIIDSSNMAEGDVLIGLASSGVHSNGYSLVRKVLNINETYNDYRDELGCTLGEELLKPTRIYVKAIRSLLDKQINIHGISHITGGGFFENVPRMMKDGLTASIDTGTFPRPAIFDILQQAGDIPTREMYNTFNMGIGMVIAVPESEAAVALEALEAAGEHAYQIGKVISGNNGVEVKF